MNGYPLKIAVCLGGSKTHGICAVQVDSVFYAFRSGLLCGASRPPVSVMLLRLGDLVRPC